MVICYLPSATKEMPLPQFWFLHQLEAMLELRHLSCYVRTYTGLPLPNDWQLIFLVGQ